IPDEELTVGARRDEAAPVGTEANLVDRFLVAGQGTALPAGSDVPPAERRVAGPGQQVLAVRRKLKAVDGITVALQRPEGAARDEIVHVDVMAEAAGRDLPPIGRNCQG